MTTDLIHVVRAVESLKSSLKNIDNNTGKLSTINQGIRDLKDSVDNLKDDIEEIKDIQDDMLKLHDRFRRMVIASAGARRYTAEKIKREFVVKHREKNAELEVEKNAIQYDYDKTQLEFIRNFIDSVSTNTSSIEIIKDEFSKMVKIQESLQDDIEDFLEHDRAEYSRRLKQLRKLIKMTLGNIDTFINKRMKTAREIEEILISYNHKRDMVLYIPFWVIGISHGRSEKIEVIPITERYEVSQSPSRETPYLFHLTKDFTNSFSSYEEFFTNRSNVEMAKRNSILNDKKFMRKVKRKLSNLKRYCDSSEPDGDSFFLKTIRRFLFKRGGR